MGCCQTVAKEPGVNIESGEYIEEEKFLQTNESKFPLSGIDVFKLIELICRTSQQWKLNQNQLKSIMNEFSIDIKPYIEDTTSPLGRFLRSLESKGLYNARSISGTIVLLSPLDEQAKAEAFFRIWCGSDALLKIAEIHHMVTRLAVLAVDKLPILSLYTEDSSAIQSKIHTYLKTLSDCQEPWINSITAKLVRHDPEHELTLGQFTYAIANDNENKAIIWPGTIRRAIFQNSFVDKPKLV